MRGVGVAGRRQHLDLPARGDHGAVRLVQLDELLHQPVGHLEGARRVEHEFAQEGVQVAQVLGRLGLVQQLQGHAGVDAQQQPQALAIALVFAEMVQVGQVLLQAAQVQVLGEAGQLALDAEGAVRDHVVPAQVGGRVAGAAYPEHLHQGDDLAEAVGVFGG